MNAQLFLTYATIASILTVVFVVVLKNIQHQFRYDELYEKAFFFDKKNIHLQFSYFKNAFLNVLFFRDNRFIDNLFYYFILPFIIVLPFLKKQLPLNNARSSFNTSIFLTSIIAFVLLFFSIWNLRSNYCSRYYIPVFYMLFLVFLFSINQKVNPLFSKIFSAIFILFTTFYSIAFLSTVKGPGALNRFSEFRKLPKGTLIAGYWDTYLIASVACENILPLAWDEPTVRNSFHKKPGLQNENFYFLNNNELKNIIKNDCVIQYNTKFIFSGKTYTCNGIEVLLYKKEKNDF